MNGSHCIFFFLFSHSEHMAWDVAICAPRGHPSVSEHILVPSTEHVVHPDHSCNPAAAQWTAWLEIRRWGQRECVVRDPPSLTCSADHVHLGVATGAYVCIWFLLQGATPRLLSVTGLQPRQQPVSDPRPNTTCSHMHL